MQGIKKKRRVRLILIGMCALVLGTAVVGYAFRGGIEFFRSPSEVQAAPPAADELFRIGGLVAEGSLIREGDLARFDVTDGGATISVTYRGVLPDLFRENQGMIGKGYLRNGVFEAEEILAKHDEKYMPREVADALKEQGVYQPSE